MSMAGSAGAGRDAAGGEDRAVVRQVVLDEAGRGERLVAWLRAVLLPLSVAFDLVVEIVDGHHELGLDLFRLLLVIYSVGWLVLLQRARFRPWMSYVSLALDLLLVVAASLGTLLVRGTTGATMFALGSAPAMSLVYFILGCAGVRQSPGACLLVGGMWAGAAVFAVPYSLARVDPTVADLVGRDYLRQHWYGVALAFACTVGLMALSARNARRMARHAGEAAAERQRVIDVFGKYVAPEVARSALSDAGTAELREVTVLFTDLRGFTQLSERLSPSDLLAALNAHYAAIVPVVQRHGGTVNKFIGDALMATFGAPLRFADHAERAVQAATEMLAEMESLRARTAGLPALEMHIGIATGPVVVGTLGASDRIEYAVIGDPVNVASRLQSLNKDLKTKVLLSAATEEALAGRVGTRGLGQVALRGRTQPMPVFTVADSEPASGPLPATMVVADGKSN